MSNDLSVLSVQDFRSSFFSQVPATNDLQATFLRNRKTNALLRITWKTTRGEMIFGGYDQIIHVDIAENELALGISVTSKNVPYAFLVKLFVSVQVVDPEFVVLKNMVDLTDYMSQNLTPPIQKVAKDYSLMEQKYLDNALEGLFSQDNYGTELKGIQYQVKTISTELTKESADIIKPLLEGELQNTLEEAQAYTKDQRMNRQARLLQRQQEHASLIMNMDPVTAAFENVLNGTMTRDEAVSQLRENERADFINKLNLADSMRQAGIKEDEIEKFLHEQVMTSMAKVPTSTGQKSEREPRLPSRTEVLNVLDEMYLDEPEDE